MELHLAQRLHKDRNDKTNYPGNIPHYINESRMAYSKEKKCNYLSFNSIHKSALA